MGTMKKVLKSRLFLVILTAIICITGTAYAATQVLASDIKYNDTTVDKALDNLYTTAEDYVKLENETTVSSTNLLNGITAYDNLGNLITGSVSTECVGGVFNCVGNCNNDTGIKIVDFEPKFFVAFKTDRIIYFNTSKNSTFTYIGILNQNLADNALISRYFTFDNGLIIHNLNATAGWKDSFEYMACK